MLIKQDSLGLVYELVIGDDLQNLHELFNNYYVILNYINAYHMVR